MTFCRVEKNKNFIVVPNHYLQNTNLSLKAIGLLSMILQLPEDFDFTIKGLAKMCKDGTDSINTAVKELEQAGYLTCNRLRNTNGRVGQMEYIINEFPLVDKADDVLE